MKSSNNLAVNTEDTASSEVYGIDYNLIKKTGKIIRALDHKLRQEMISVIFNNPGITVTNLYVKLRLEQSVASQHLAVLRNAGVVSIERRGKFINYTLNTERIENINTNFRRLFG